MYAYIYEMNILVDLMCWSMYEMIILSESVDSLNVVIHLLWHLVEHRCSLAYRSNLFCWSLGPDQPFVVIQVAPVHLLPSPWLNQKQDAQKLDPCLHLKINITESYKRPKTCWGSLQKQGKLHK